AMCSTGIHLLSEDSEGILSDRNIAPLSSKPFKREQVIIRLKQARTKPESERIFGDRFEFTFSPDIPAVGGRKNGTVRLKIRIGLQFEQENDRFRRGGKRYLVDRAG